MATPTDQEQIWDILHQRITQTMQRFGTEDGLGNADYWIVSDNWGSRQHKIFFNRLHLLRPQVIKRLQESLADFPNWEIVIAISLRGPGELWPDMGLVVRAHEVVDKLQRQYFPTEFQTIKYEGSRRGAG
jgi:hypothetical protein